jgi:hypothetical protein
MTFHKRIWFGLLFIGLAGTGGCGVQDPDQPAVGSISVGARRDDSAPSLSPGKVKPAPASRK